MDNQRTQPQEESLKNNDQPLDGQHGSSSGTQQGDSSRDKQREHRHVSADQINGIIGSATSNVHARHHSGGAHWSDVGTNISYEGATAPGAGGSVGTGEASGQSATGSSIQSSSVDQAVSGANHPHSQQQGADDQGRHTGEPNPLQKEHDDELDRDTLGTP